MAPLTIKQKDHIIKQLIKRKIYEIEFSEDGYLVLKRSNYEITNQEIQEFIDNLWTDMVSYDKFKGIRKLKK